MPDSNSIEKDFLSKLRDIIQENISDEMFGVSELAKEIGISSPIAKEFEKLLSRTLIIYNKDNQRLFLCVQLRIYLTSECFVNVGKF